MYKAYKSGKVICAACQEADEIVEHIKNRCFWSPNSCGDLMKKYSDLNDTRGFRASCIKPHYYMGSGQIEISYAAVGNYRNTIAPIPKVAFMVRDAILDFDMTLPVRVLVSSEKNHNLTEYCFAEFTILPNTKKIDDIHYWWYDSNHSDRPYLLKNIDTV